MSICALCGAQIPEKDKQDLFEEARELLGVREFDSGNETVWTLMAHLKALVAWECDRCGQWICNGCVIKTALEHQAGRIAHADCGGMFRAPGEPEAECSICGEKGKRLVGTIAYRFCKLADTQVYPGTNLPSSTSIAFANVTTCEDCVVQRGNRDRRPAKWGWLLFVVCGFVLLSLSLSPQTFGWSEDTLFGVRCAGGLALFFSLFLVPVILFGLGLPDAKSCLLEEAAKRRFAARYPDHFHSVLEYGPQPGVGYHVEAVR